MVRLEANRAQDRGVMANLKVKCDIRMHRGHIMVGMLVRDDVVYVRAFKEDLLNALCHLPEDSVRSSIRDGVLYVDAAS